MITSSDVRTRYPEFESSTVYPDARIDMYIGDAVADLNEQAWSTHYDRGLLALTAHFLSMGQKQLSGDGLAPSASNVTARSIGDVSVSFGGAAMAATDVLMNGYMATIYGQEFMRLVYLYGAGALTI